ncbi:hypothetical protein F2P79_002098 [Pimephales promelas]|nr:hypothetical protein F2P79_002098 [Pimephales promelas]
MTERRTPAANAIHPTSMPWRREMHELYFSTVLERFALPELSPSVNSLHLDKHHNQRAEKRKSEESVFRAAVTEGRQYDASAGSSLKVRALGIDLLSPTFERWRAHLKISGMRLWRETTERWMDR